MAHSVLEKKASGLNSTTLDLWREIPGWEGFYEVSRLGEVRSMTRRVPHGRGFDMIRGAQHLKLHTKPKGYLAAKLMRAGEQSHRFVHCLVLEAFVGPRPDGQQCRHLDGNPANNKLENLVWGSAKENASDRVAHGTSKGQRNPNAQITAFQAFMLQTSPLGATALAKASGISVHLINGIKCGRRWSWL